jgi:hypothetical protein
MNFPSWSAYSSIYNLGHKALAALKNQEVLVQEKIDGSQISFGVDLGGNLHVRSKSATINPEAPEKLFQKGVEVIKSLKPKLRPGWTYRGEYLQKPKHNALAYDRIPNNHIILFDINTDLEDFAPYTAVVDEGRELGLEVVPLLMAGIPALEDLRGLLERESVLGGQKIEGVVLKPIHYNIFGMDKKVLMGKHVSEAFREIHKQEWKLSNPSRTDFIDLLAQQYTTPARWNKAIIHLREQGLIQDSPKDIGLIMKEVPLDILKECEQEIKDKLFEYFWPAIRRKSTYGLPEYYKDQLLEAQFSEDCAARG